MPVDSGSSLNWIRICAWCGRLLPEQDGTLREHDASSLVTHGICPTCLDKWVGGFKPSFPNRFAKDRHAG